MGWNIGGRDMSVIQEAFDRQKECMQELTKLLQAAWKRADLQETAIEQLKMRVSELEKRNDHNN